MMNKIRAAVVGAGIYGKHHMNAYRHNPDTVLVAICDTDTERCDDLAMAYGIMGYTRLDVSSAGGSHRRGLGGDAGPVPHRIHPHRPAPR